MTAPETLLPCPFCGSQPKLSRTSSSDERCGYNFTVFVQCQCSATIGVESHHDKQGWCSEGPESVEKRAAAAWNRRLDAIAQRAGGETG